MAIVIKMVFLLITQEDKFTFSKSLLSFRVSFSVSGPIVSSPILQFCLLMLYKWEKSHYILVLAFLVKQDPAVVVNLSPWQQLKGTVELEHMLCHFPGLPQSPILLVASQLACFTHYVVCLTPGGLGTGEPVL